jgi:hypothetical protein
LESEWNIFSFFSVGTFSFLFVFFVEFVFLLFCSFVHLYIVGSFVCFIIIMFVFFCQLLYQTTQAQMQIQNNKNYIKTRERLATFKTNLFSNGWHSCPHSHWHVGCFVSKTFVCCLRYNQCCCFVLRFVCVGVSASFGFGLFSFRSSLR